MSDKQDGKEKGLCVQVVHKDNPRPSPTLFLSKNHVGNAEARRLTAEKEEQQTEHLSPKSTREQKAAPDPFLQAPPDCDEETDHNHCRLVREWKRKSDVLAYADSTASTSASVWNPEFDLNSSKTRMS